MVHTIQKERMKKKKNPDYTEIFNFFNHLLLRARNNPPTFKKSSIKDGALL